MEIRKIINRMIEHILRYGGLARLIVEGTAEANICSEQIVQGVGTNSGNKMSKHKIDQD